MAVKNTKVKQKTYLAQEISVSKDGKLVGTGHIAYDEHGKRFVSEFIGPDGEALPDDWYDVTPTGKEWLQVVPCNKQ